MADLADALGVTPRNVTALVDGLESEHLVRRLPHPTDRRVTMVEITGGAAAVEDQFGSFRRAIDDLLDGLPEQDRRTLARVLPALEARGIDRQEQREPHPGAEIRSARPSSQRA